MWKRLLKSVRPSRKRPRPVKRSLHVQGLEDRYLPSTLVALTTDNRLLRFDSDAASRILATTPITGLQSGESVLGIDVRPSTAELYAVGSTNRLYVIDANTGVATLKAALTADPADTTNPFTGLVGTNFGVDFNPAADRLRVVSDADQNLRINPNTGTVTTDDTIAFAAGTPHFGEDPAVVDLAYSNNIPAGSGSPTTLYGLESNIHILVRQDPPNSGTLTKVAPFGKEGALPVGFDISPTGTAYVAVDATGVLDRRFLLVGIDLATGADNSHGTIGDGNTAVRDIAVVPAVEFTSSIFAVDEAAGSVTITITRTDVSVGTATVNFEAVSGTATAGSDFTAVSGPYTLGAGALSLGVGETKVISIPINNDSLSEGDETFLLRLTDAKGLAVIGAQSTAVVRINKSDQTDRAGAHVVSVAETGPSRGITGFRAVFNEDMNIVRAENVGNYSFFGIDRGGVRTSIALRSADYDPVTRAVTVTFAKTLRQSQFAQLEIRLNGTRGAMLTDLSGNAMDGNRDNVRGGDAVFRFQLFSGTSVTITDRDGDQATINIANGGSLDGIAPILGPATQRPQFWILDPIALRSTLSGTVRPRGDGIVVIAEIIGLDKKEFTPLLTNTSFRVNTLTFSSNATGIG
jgi:hypothetical protein